MGIVNDATMHLACTIDRGTRLRGMDAGDSLNIYCMMGQLSAPTPRPPRPLWIDSPQIENKAQVLNPASFLRHCARL